MERVESNRWWEEWARRAGTMAAPGGHDPLVCGLDPVTDCTDCRARALMADGGAAGLALAGRELSRLAERWGEASARLHAATVAGDAGAIQAAELQCRAALGAFWSVGEGLAGLLLLLLRSALQHAPDTLRLYLAEALRPELAAIARRAVRTPLEVRP